MSEEPMVSDKTFGELTDHQRAMLNQAHRGALRAVRAWNDTLRGAGVPVRLTENIGVTPDAPPSTAPQADPAPAPPPVPQPYTGSTCDYCGHATMVPAGTCEKCLNCGAAGECG